MDIEQILREAELRRKNWRGEDMGRLMYAPEIWKETEKEGIAAIFQTARIVASRNRLKNRIKKNSKAAQSFLAAGQENKAVKLAVMMVEDNFRLQRYTPPSRFEEFQFLNNHIPAPKDETLTRAIRFLEEGKLFQATYEIHQLVQTEMRSELLTDLLTPELMFLSAALYQVRDNPRQMHELYHISITDKIRESGLPAEFYNESRNKVYTIRWDDFPVELIFAKEYRKKETYAAEMLNSLLFRQWLGDCVQEFITDTHLEADAGFYRAAGDRTLLEQIDSGKKRRTAKAVEQAAILLAHIHVLGTKINSKGIPPGSAAEAEIIDNLQGRPRAFTGKMIDTLLTYTGDDEQTQISPAVKQRLMNAYTPINDALYSAPRDYYKDHNPRNIVLDNKGKLTAIDFETDTMMPCQIDLVSLLEFGSDYLTPRQRQKAIRSYIIRKERLLQRCIHMQGFMQIYAYARVQRHLELAGYRARDARNAPDPELQQQELARKQYHLEKACESSAALADAATDKATRTELKGVLESITEIRNNAKPE